MKILIKNRKAYFNYTILQEYTAGMVLTGTEVKSARSGKCSLDEGYCFFYHGELWLKNAYIPKYSHGSYMNHEERRLRKLLLSKKELNQIRKHLEQKGNTLVPLQMFLSDKGFIKLKIGAGKGKKLYDKRETIKKREIDRIIKTELKNKGFS